MTKEKESIIIKCKCVGPNANGPAAIFQDHQYGKDNRVANWARNANNKAGGWRCTVCGMVKN